ncbi:MAG: ABC transporter ATP-binding protein [Faecousia sp.]
MASLSLQHITKVYDNKVMAVSDFNMEIEDKEFIVFVGPSGCGKSTTLRMIAGLEEITGGDLYIDGKRMNDVEPKDRDIAMVFQNYALYPHKTVYQNMAFALRMRKVPKDQIRARVEEAAKILDITDYLDRKPKALSGGQRQRVALGRAIVREPKVFLLDEPLSNLDAKLRTAMRTEITKLHQKLQTTFIYVTHDQVEAMTMGTRIVVMKDGVIQQIAPPQVLYDYPANVFVASFIGTPQMNFFDGKLAPDGSVTLASGQVIRLNSEKMATLEKLQAEREIILGIRPEDIHLASDEQTENVLEARVDVIEALGGEALLYCSLNLEGEASIVAEKSEGALVAKIGAREPVSRNEIRRLFLEQSHIHVFDKATEKTLTVASAK